MGFVAFGGRFRSVAEANLPDMQVPANRMLAVVIFFLVYLIIGAGIFSATEAPSENQRVLELKEQLGRFVEVHEECLDFDELELLVAKITEAVTKGVSPLKNVSHEPIWTFGQSFFFAGTLLSTVGYGHVSPSTQGGKFFTIIYAVIGIPLCLTLLTALADRLRTPSYWFLGVLNRRFGHVYEAARIRYIHLALTVALILVFCFIIPAIIFEQIEHDWTYLDAFYYCFISLTTVGLGDYIPGDKPGQELRALYKILATIYLLFGLCCMMLLLATLYDVPQLSLRSILLLKHESDDPSETVNFAEQAPSGPKYTQHMDNDSIAGEGDGFDPRTATNPLAASAAAWEDTADPKGGYQSYQ